RGARRDSPLHFRFAGRDRPETFPPYGLKTRRGKIMREAVHSGHAKANPLVSMKIRQDKVAKKPELAGKRDQRRSSTFKNSLPAPCCSTMMSTYAGLATNRFSIFDHHLELGGNVLFHRN